jgi:hypothetical protein
MDHNLRIIAAPLAGLLLLAGLVACDGGDPAAAETPTPTPTVVTPNPTPTLSPTPTPTGPQWAADDPAWTENQLAAVRAVDEYNIVFWDLATDPPNADLIRLVPVVVEPQYSSDLGLMFDMMELGNAALGGPPVPVSRQVGVEETVDGHQEIRIRQCEERPDDMILIKAGEPTEWTAIPRSQKVYVVQWQEERGRWAVALYEGTGVAC